MRVVLQGTQTPDSRQKSLKHSSTAVLVTLRTVLLQAASYVIYNHAYNGT